MSATTEITTLAWLAGLLEGEGCFHRRSDTGRTVLRLSMTDEDVVRRAATVMDCPYSLQVPHRPQDRRQWQIYVGGAKAENVMRRIRPFMGERRGNTIDALLAAVQLPSDPRDDAPQSRPATSADTLFEREAA